MNYELGYRKKSETSLLNISFFVSDRIEQQVSISAQQYDNDPNSFYYFTANSGKGWLRGLELEYDFNFLTVAQMGPRKNIENTIRWFIDEFHDDEVGLIVKTNIGIVSKLNVDSECRIKDLSLIHI